MQEQTHQHGAEEHHSAMTSEELLAKFREVRIAIDIYEDALVDALKGVIDSLDKGDVESAKQELRSLVGELESDGGV